MNFANLSSKNTGYIWLAGTLFVCLLFVYIFYDLILTPQLVQKEQLNNQLLAEENKVAMVERFDAAHPDRAGYLQELDREIGRVNNLLPDTENIGEVIHFLESTAKNTNVVFGALTSDKSVYKNGWTESRMVFKVLGTYSDLLEFSRQLENGPRFLAVRAVEFHDRVMLNQAVLGQEEIQKMLEKELSGKGSVLIKPVIERGLLNKPNLIIMNVYLMAATQGCLPDAENAPNESQKVPAKS